MTAARNFRPLYLEESSRPLRVSLVNLQKFTFQAWLLKPSMKMLAPEQNTLSRRLVTTTVRTSGVLKADAVDGVVQFNVDAKIVTVELQLVAGTDATVLIKAGSQRGDRAVKLRLQCLYWAGVVW